MHRSDKKLEDLHLDRLQISQGLDYEPEKAALDGTRVEVMSEIHAWINGASDDLLDSRAFLLLGQAGVGKSAIAHRVAQELKHLERLGAFFRFSSSKRVDSEHFFRTIARRIADLDPAYAATLMAYTDSTLNSTPSPARQLKELLTKPFETLSALGTLVIVVDALDECPEGSRDELIQCLHDNITSFPKNIRFVITSRPSEAENLHKCPWVYTHDLKANALTDSDIYMFVKSRLGDIVTKELPRGFDRPQLDAIVKSAQGVFQYAAVVCNEINSARKRRREPLPRVYARLMEDGSQGLDSLYLAILNAAFPASTTSLDVPGSSELQEFHLVMGWVLHSQAPLSRHVLQSFAAAQVYEEEEESFVEPDEGDDEYGLVASVLHPLGALLSGTDSSKSPVSPLHSSFRDFLTEKSRSGHFHIGPASGHHMNLAVTCLRIMEQELHFNMASLESSYVLNSDVPNFAQRIEAGVSKTLSYACLHWIWHLKMSAVSEQEFKEMDLIHNFLDNLFLFWFEALGLIAQAAKAENNLMTLKNWSQVNVCLLPLSNTKSDY